MRATKFDSKARRNHTLTDDLVKALPAPTPDGRQRLIWDRELVGLAVLCSGSTSVKSFVVQHRNRRLVLERCSYMTVEEARIAALDTIKAIRRGDDPKAAAPKLKPETVPQGPTLQSVLDAYMQKELRPQTRKFYNSIFKNHLADWSGKPISAIDEPMLRERHAAILAKVRKRGAGTGAATANGMGRLMSAVLNFGRRQYKGLTIAEVRDALHDSWVKERKRTGHVPIRSMPVFYATLRAIPDEFRSAAVELLLLSGCRLNEILRLGWSEVRLDERLIILPAERTKAHREHHIPLSDRCVAILRGLASKRRAKCDYVFHGRAGRPITDLADAFSTLSKATGIHLSAHDLRRTFASYGHAAGVDGLIVGRLINHSSPHGIVSGQVSPITSRYIISDLEHTLRPAQQKITDYILSAAKIEKPMPRRRIKRHSIREAISA